MFVARCVLLVVGLLGGLSVCLFVCRLFVRLCASFVRSVFVVCVLFVICLLCVVRCLLSVCCLLFVDCCLVVVVRCVLFVVRYFL